MVERIDSQFDNLFTKSVNDLTDYVLWCYKEARQGLHYLSMRDNGQGQMARTWDHWITIEPLSANRCRYTDRVTIQAGFMTPFVWLFALGFYAWRQYCWQRLVQLNFQPINYL